LIQNYPELAKNYPIIGKLKLDSTKENDAFNILLADKDFDNDKSNLYTQDLKKLSDRTVVKLTDPEENARLSDMFKYLNTFAFLQTGLNKTKLSFTNVVDYTDFLSIVEGESSKFIEALNKKGFTLLDNFYDQFIRENNKKISPNRDRFKDYLSTIDYENVERILPVENPTIKKDRNAESDVEEVILDSTNQDTIAEVKRFNLKNTDDPNVYTYNDKNATNATYYLNLGKNNPDVVFVHNISIYEIKPEQIAAGRNLGGSAYFMTEVGDMSVNFPTDLFASVVNGRKIDIASDQYQTLKNIWEKRINILKQIQEKGGKLAFPEYGFGDPNTMPQELFVYLSKRLFEEFGYINPGSTKYNQVREMIIKTQGISDEEIEMQLELEEDPFKCS
jgi:acyl carrier protein phosphodiesterase